MAATATAHVPMETMEEDMDTIPKPPDAGRARVGGVDDGQIQQGTMGHGPKYKQCPRRHLLGTSRAVDFACTL